MKLKLNLSAVKTQRFNQRNLFDQCKFTHYQITSYTEFLAQISLRLFVPLVTYSNDRVEEVPLKSTSQLIEIRLADYAEELSVLH